MADLTEHRALGGLVSLPGGDVSSPTRRLARPPAMGYQPALDGVRAVSVTAVLLYHAGFSWMHGGFFGVEVFFVVSGFLITSLLLDEQERSGRVALGQFWLRRARRLLPALVLVLVAVGVYASLRGSALTRSDLRRDYPWALLYAANWGQIVGGAQYFGNLSPLRHLWSLAVEEQWYLVWPLAFLALTRLARRTAVRAGVLYAMAVGVMVLTWWMSREPQLTDDRVNFLYLSTLTRASGLLLGAASAFVWRPWRTRHAAESRAAGALDTVAVLAVAVLVWSFVEARVVDRSIYRWHLAVVSLASLVLVLVVAHPASRLARPVFAWRPLVEVGKRSYGLYLWSWPVSVVCEAYTGSWGRFALAMAITAAISEASYRWVETPIRRGALGAWFARQRARDGHWYVGTTSAAVSVIALVGPLVLFFRTVDHVDPAQGGEQVEFVLPAAGSATGADGTAVEASSTRLDDVSPASTLPTSTPLAATGGVATTVPASSTTVPPPVTAPVLPRRMVVVGDSMAHSLAINLPDGIDQTFAIADGSVEGCSVYDDGDVRSSRRGFSRSFANCAGWSQRWVDAATRSQSNLALVVIGAWDVFDVEVDGTLVTFGSPAGDARFVDGLTEGIDALAAQGVHVALLEVACMRPQDVKGAGVPALPERGDDSRVAHLNELMRGIADARPDEVTFVPGPAQWCADETISTDLGYRWDGVHVYVPGANLIYTTIAPALLSIPL
ncbi:MAG: acyltransferase family protein [Acidimicrobiales bacterium]